MTTTLLPSEPGPHAVTLEADARRWQLLRCAAIGFAFVVAQAACLAAGAIAFLLSSLGMSVCDDYGREAGIGLVYAMAGTGIAALPTMIAAFVSRPGHRSWYAFACGSIVVVGALISAGMLLNPPHSCFTF